jgi:catechol 2,3-dioxygenase-like lactoylglutathione lyase family enzyme
MCTMRILGLTFGGTATPQRAAMAIFVRDTLGLTAVNVAGVEADLFELPDGSLFAVSEPGGMGDTARSIGFLVEDLDAAVQTLTAADTDVGPVAENARQRYAHFRAPDGNLYEIVENKADAS